MSLTKKDLGQAIEQEWKLTKTKISKAKKAGRKSIHDLRVQLNQLIAWIELSSVLNPVSWEKTEKKLYEFREELGDLRDLQVALKYLGQHPENYLPDFIKYLQHKEKKLRSQTQKFLEHFPQKKLERKILSLKSSLRHNPLTFHDLEQLVHKKVSRKYQDFDSMDEGDFHPKRIQGRMLKYMSMAEKKLTGKTKVDLKELSSQLDRWGEMQNERVLSKKLGQYLRKRF